MSAEEAPQPPEKEPDDLAWHEYIARVAITMTDYEPDFGKAEHDPFMDDVE